MALAVPEGAVGPAGLDAAVSVGAGAAHGAALGTARNRVGVAAGLEAEGESDQEGEWSEYAVRWFHHRESDG